MSKLLPLNVIFEIKCENPIVLTGINNKITIKYNKVMNLFSFRKDRVLGSNIITNLYLEIFS